MIYLFLVGIISLILPFVIDAWLFWGIGAFIVWVFNISYVWTFWHGLASAILYFILESLLTHIN